MRSRISAALALSVMLLVVFTVVQAAGRPAVEQTAKQADPSKAVVAASTEGMWPLDTMDETVFQRMRLLGLELSKKGLYDPKGTGVAYAVVQIGGGTGSFVSPKGLILTNHHVAFTALQRASVEDTVHNYIEEGLSTASYAEEIPAQGYRASVLVSIEDVTDDVMGAVSEGMTGIERYEAIEMRIKELVDKAEKDRDVECRVASFYDGMQYKLFTFFTIKDVRIVYAPPRSIGNYGGDIDNWMWPRHTGDFSFLRAYVAPDGGSAEYAEENVPYEPKVFLPVSTKGVKAGDFTMIVGFPGQTMRYRSSYSIDHAENFSFPARIRMFGDLLTILQEESRRDPAVAVKVASLDAMLNNSMKNYQGQLEGFRKAHLLERKVEEEKKFTAWLGANPEMKKKYGDVLPSIAALYEEQVNRTRDKSQITRFVGFGCQMMRAAGTLYRWSVEKAKDDLEREPGYQERDVPRLKQSLQMIDRSYDEPTDRRILRYFMMLALELPPDQRIEALDAMMAETHGESDETKIAAIIDGLYRGTKLGFAGERLRMFDLTRDELLAENDSFIAFAAALYPELEALEESDKAFNGAITELRPRLIEAYKVWKGGALYPDANGTMRLTYGTVEGYAPRDAVEFDYITSLSGVIEKYTGVDPFDAPAKLVELSEKRDFGPYVDAALGDVPVDFLSTCDITGGNSGSPILNARGEVIGAAFDGNWESISADYLFNARVTRAINVDARYVLFILDRFSGARRLLEEMEVR